MKKAMDVSKFGVGTPLLVVNPNSGDAWETASTFQDAAEIVRNADRLGYDHVSCAEHIGLPSAEAGRRGVRYYDPLATFGYFSAITRQIRFATAVLVLGYHHPLEIAKRYGTLDVVSGGRLILGLGVGSLKEEFELLGLGGTEFTERGPRGDDALRALRASLGQREPAYQGPYYDFSGLIVEPHAVQQHVPFWIGGRSGLSLRRAVELGDAWMPFGLTTEQMAAMVARARETPAWNARERPLEMVFPAKVDPLGEPQKTADTIGLLFEAGATRLTLSCKSKSVGDYIEQLEALATLKAT
jgi:probable F420-dependent oxidoreductase